MRLLLDECVPRPLLRDLTAHDARHVVDKQNLRASGISVVVAVSRTNRVKELRPLIPKILAALAGVKPGEFVTVGG